MILAVRKHAVNVPIIRWVSSAGFGVELVQLTDWHAVKDAPLLFWLLGFGLFAWTLAGTMSLQVEDDLLIVITVFKRSELHLADCRFCVQRVGGRKRGSFLRILVSDGRSTRTVVPWYFPMEWRAERVVNRLAKNLLP